MAVRNADASIRLFSGDAASRLSEQPCIDALGRKRHWSVTLSSDASRHWLVAPPPGLASFNELKAFAEARFQALYGEPSSAWLITGDWQANNPFLCAAVPRRLVSLLDQLAKSCQCKLHVTTTVAALLKSHLHQFQRDGWTAVQTPSSLLVACFSKGRLVEIRVMPSSQEQDAPAQQALAITEVRRSALRAGRGLSDVITWLDLGGKASQAEPMLPLKRPLEHVDMRAEGTAPNCEAIFAALMA